MLCHGVCGCCWPKSLGNPGARLHSKNRQAISFWMPLPELAEAGRGDSLANRRVGRPRNQACPFSMRVKSQDTLAAWIVLRRPILARACLEWQFRRLRSVPEDRRDRGPRVQTQIAVAIGFRVHHCEGRRHQSRNLCSLENSRRSRGQDLRNRRSIYTVHPSEAIFKAKLAAGSESFGIFVHHSLAVLWVHIA